MPIYAIINSETNVVEGYFDTDKIYTEVAAKPPAAQNGHVLRGGKIVPAPVLTLSIAAPGGPETSGWPVAGEPFNVFVDAAEEWREAMPNLFDIQVNDCVDLIRITVKTPLMLDAGSYTMQIVGPSPWRSNKLSFTVEASENEAGGGV